LKNGTPRNILADYHPPALSLYALYPPTRHLAVKVRLFIRFSHPADRVIRATAAAEQYQGMSAA